MTRLPAVHLAMLLGLTLLCGCGGPQYAEVRGKVTFDGEPLAGATLEFLPAGGSPAYGVTNEQGEYELLFSADQRGAPLGTNTVRITSFNEAKPRVKERVPVKYNRQTDLVREVKNGQNRFDFELLSK